MRQSRPTLSDDIMAMNTEIWTNTANQRAFATDNIYIYHSALNDSKLKISDARGSLISEINLKSMIGAIKFQDGYFYIGTYSSTKSRIIKTTQNFKVVQKFDYLRSIPPKYLPPHPYQNYVVGITVSDKFIFITLQNGKYIYKLNKNGCFIGIIEVPKRSDGSPIDISGIDICGEEFISADISESKIYKGENVILNLEKHFHPFDICYSFGKLYVISSNLGKIDVYNTNLLFNF